MKSPLQNGEKRTKLVKVRELTVHDVYKYEVSKPPTMIQGKKSYVDIVKKDIHLFKKLRTKPKKMTLKSTSNDVFEIKGSRPLRQPPVNSKDCYYKRGSSNKNIIDVKSNIEELKRMFGSMYDDDYLEVLFDLHDSDLTKTSRYCTLMVAWSRSEKLRQFTDLKEVKKFLKFWLDNYLCMFFGEISSHDRLYRFLETINFDLDEFDCYIRSSTERSISPKECNTYKISSIYILFVLV